MGTAPSALSRCGAIARIGPQRQPDPQLPSTAPRRDAARSSPTYPLDGFQVDLRAVLHAQVVTNALTAANAPRADAGVLARFREGGNHVLPLLTRVIADFQRTGDATAHAHGCNSSRKADCGSALASSSRRNRSRSARASSPLKPGALS
ncbi:hypothetical protein XFF6994_2340002 [Xanthomonas citri pv. fuscans]|nr:hypothetical protein XFF6994_2340002 [Xanthomonas citri pv. fuscans]